MIYAQELADVLKKKGFNLSKADIDIIIEQVDYCGNGKINYSDFLVATMDARSFLSGEDKDQKMQAVF